MFIVKGLADGVLLALVVGITALATFSMAIVPYYRHHHAIGHPALSGGWNYLAHSHFLWTLMGLAFLVGFWIAQV